MNFNRVYLIGRITKVEYAYYFKGEYFIRACMLVERTSGNSDLIPVVIPMSFITEEDIGSNKKLSLCGEIRKYYGKIYVFAIKAKFISSTFEDRNEVELTAFISDISEIRVTPVSRKTIISFSVVCHDNQKRYCRIPCICLGRGCTLHRKTCITKWLYFFNWTVPIKEIPKEVWGNRARKNNLWDILLQNTTDLIPTSSS